MGTVFVMSSYEIILFHTSFVLLNKLSVGNPSEIS